jgi:hypothetical protein
MTSTSGGSAGSTGSAGAKGPDELRQQIEMTRHQLGDTVEELVAKTDVKARARAQVAELRGTASHAAHSVRERVPSVRAPRAVVIGGVGVGVAAAAAGALAWRQHDAPRVLLSGRRGAPRVLLSGRRGASKALSSGRRGASKALSSGRRGAPRVLLSGRRGSSAALRRDVARRLRRLRDR